MPIIAFSTDAGVAASGVYLLSFLPESEVDRVIGYAIQQGKRSFAALIPDNAYGTVVQAAFQQAVARGGGRVVVMERYPLDRAQMQGPVQRVAQAARQIDAIFIPDGADSVSAVVQALTAAGVPRKQLIGTGLWDDPRLASEPGAQGGWFATPDPSGFRAFSGRYRQRYGQDPVRPATLAYDAVSLVAALVKTQGPARFSPETLTNPSGFAGIDGVFRFRPDGTNQRGARGDARHAVRRDRSSARRRRCWGRAVRRVYSAASAILDFSVSLRRSGSGKRARPSSGTRPSRHLLQSAFRLLIDQLHELSIGVVLHLLHPR